MCVCLSVCLRALTPIAILADDELDPNSPTRINTVKRFRSFVKARIQGRVDHFLSPKEPVHSPPCRLYKTVDSIVVEKAVEKM